jgi:hypothetical protein
MRAASTWSVYDDQAVLHGRGALAPLVRRISGVTASVLLGAVLLVPPKCPLCLAAWLAVVTGVGVSAAAAARMRGGIVAFWALTQCLSAVRLIRSPRSRSRRSCQRLCRC